MSLGAFAQSEVGIYRPLDLKILEVGDPAVKEAYGVKITEIRGKDATFREEAGQETSDASDLYIGYNVTGDPAQSMAASAVYAADNVIYPKLQSRLSVRLKNTLDSQWIFLKENL